MKRSILTAMAAVLMLAGVAQAALVIDDFSDYMTPVVAPAIDDSPYGWYINPT